MLLFFVLFVVHDFLFPLGWFIGEFSFIACPENMTLITQGLLSSSMKTADFANELRQLEIFFQPNQHSDQNNSTL